MEYQTIIFAALFLLGSIPSGYFVARCHGIDIRKHGSGNIGATNMARVLGRRAGLITFGCDFLKGFIASLIGFLVIPNFVWASFAVILGHCFSPFLNGKGGRGVATGLGAFLFSLPIAAVGALASFCVIFWLRRIVSLASIVAAVFLPVIAYLIYGTWVAPFLASLVVVLRHKDNIARLIEGKEESFKVSA